MPLIPSLQCAAFIEKSELTTGGSLPLTFLPPIPILVLLFLILFLVPRSLLRALFTLHHSPILPSLLLALRSLSATAMTPSYTGGSLESKQIRRNYSGIYC